MLDVEMQTGAFLDKEHLAIVYWGTTGGGGGVSKASSAMAAVLNGDKKTVAAAIKDATPSFATSATLFCCFSPSMWFGAMSTGCIDFDFAGATNPSTDWETAKSAMAAAITVDESPLNISTSALKLLGQVKSVVFQCWATWSCSL